MKKQSLHTIVWKEGNIFVAKFLELEIASQGKSKKEAIGNLKEALSLFLEGENISNLPFPSVDEVSTQTISV
ncbi:MAG: type II toxin-antitoxin system HicB family antitoxin [Candidatus Levybacteria bacterium]|nr:type II toxin-antitoxin system HicB family antitoxin [Candidatus Levybacteria bacterium]